MRGLAWLLAAVGCSPGGGTYQEAVTEFVEAWAQGGLLCEQQAVCNGPALGVCGEVALPAEELVAGVHHAHLDIRAIERCQDSASELGFCVASLDCVALADAEQTCASELERYSIDCAAFLTALDYLGLVGSGGAPATGGVSSGGADGGSGGAVRPSGGASSGGRAGGGGPSSGGSGGEPWATGGSGSGGSGGSHGLSQALCSRAEHCGGVRWTPEQVAVCAAETPSLFGTVVPDPEATETCIETAPCALLEYDPASTVAACIDLASASCPDTGTLRVCSSSVVCSDVSCRDVCAAQGALTLGCGPKAPSMTADCLCSP